jgi:hypothetical protein
MPFSPTQHYSFSGTDFRCIAYFGDEFSRRKDARKTSVELTPVTVSVSVASEKSDARTLNRNYVAGFTNSITSVGGTLVFSIINEDPLTKLKELQELESYEFIDSYMRTPYQGRPLSTEALEPFTLKLVGMTEADDAFKTIKRDDVSNSLPKNYTYFLIEGIEIVGSGQVLSVHNVLTEKTYTFKARRFHELKNRSAIYSNNTKADGEVTLSGGTLRQTSAVRLPVFV